MIDGAIRTVDDGPGQPETLTVQPALVYTPAQIAAIETLDGNLQIIACAGSGKTQVIAERLAYILEHRWEEGVRPRHFVAFTFTDRAAAALKDRIAKRIRARLGNIPGLAEMYVGTIHGYCLDLLQRRVPEYFKYQVLTEVQTKLLVDRNSVRSGLSSLGLRRYIDSGYFLQAMDILREGTVDPTKLECRPLLHALGMYEQLLTDKHYLDYTAIMAKAVACVSQDQVLRAELAEQVQYLVVDEYQDVNPLQEELIRHLHGLGARICVVGDDDQALYGFRGADVSNILEFASRYPDVTKREIAENFRSSSGIVDLATAVIANNDPDRLTKDMRSASHQTFTRGDILCESFETPESEANEIVAKIQRLYGAPFKDEPQARPRGLAYSDFAILLRSVRSNAGPILEALEAAKIPAVVIGFNNLFERPEIAACVALFGYVVNEVSEAELADTWRAADIGYSTADWDAALDLVRERREWPPTSKRDVYTLQRTFLDFLERLNLREERIPSRAGEIIYYNLGKFSQVISDFENIHFHSQPAEKHQTFYGFLVHNAPSYYPEGAQDNALATPDAVQVMTVHQSKGLEWPVVFVPALLRNRFPAAGVGGRTVWNVLPQAAVAGADRYGGGMADERRVFYVALTRSQKYLYCSYAPIAGKGNRYARPSAFVAEMSRPQIILTRDPQHPLAARLTPQPRTGVVNVALTFSQFKYFRVCPYQFKLRFMYGFNAPLDEPLGYGKSLHDALAEIHKDSLEGRIPGVSAVPALVERHLHVPFAYPALRDQLLRAGIKSVTKYLEQNRPNLSRLEYAEQPIELDLGGGVVVNGRVDLIRHLDTNETAIVDFKSNERSQAEDVSVIQLHIYTVGYRELTGRSADLIEIHALEEGSVKRQEVSTALEERTLGDIRAAASALRANDLPRLNEWSHAACGVCDFRAICRSKADA